MNVGGVSSSPIAPAFPPLAAVLQPQQLLTSGTSQPVSGVGAATRYGDAVSGDRGRMPLVDALFALHVAHARPATSSLGRAASSASEGAAEQRAATSGRQLASRQSSTGIELLTDRGVSRAQAHPFLANQGLGTTLPTSARATSNPLAEQVAQAYRAVALAG